MSRPLPEWTRRYLGLPWRKGGVNHTGVDCWGLLRLVLAEQAHILLPNYSALHPTSPQDRRIYRAELAALMADRLEGWHEIDREDAGNFDGLHIPIAGEYCHVAVACGPGQAIHVHEKMTNVEGLDLAHPKWRARADRMRVYRRVEMVSRLNRANATAGGTLWTAP